MEHTPEPWYQKKWYVEAGENVILAAMGRRRYYQDSPRRKELEQLDIANARRAAVCVNACKNLNTDDLENASRVEIVFPWEE